MTIRDWPTPKSMSEVRSFHGLASFYRRFIKDFSTIVIPLNELVKKGVDFKWDNDQAKGFATLKQKIINASFIVLFNFSKKFEVECDASNIGDEVVLLQEEHPITYFNERLNESHQLFHLWKRALYYFENFGNLATQSSFKWVSIFKVKSHV